MDISQKYDQLRSYLLNSDAYKWLLDSARAAARISDQEGTILDQISRTFDDGIKLIRPQTSRRFVEIQAQYHIDWDLCNFLEEQDYGIALDTAFERAITLTGSCTNAQALSCRDYMFQTWPSGGIELMNLLAKALVSEDRTCFGKHVFQVHRTRQL
jgi:hypothetical protein